MEPLVRLRSVADAFSDSCEIADYDRSYPSLVEGIDKPRRGFVQQILDLIADLL
jgi:hypothetical protein